MIEINKGHVNKCPCIYCPDKHDFILKPGDRLISSNPTYKSWGIVTIVALLQSYQVIFSRSDVTHFQKFESLTDNQIIIDRLSNLQINGLNNFDEWGHNNFLKSSNCFKILR